MPAIATSFTHTKATGSHQQNIRRLVAALVFSTMAAVAFYLLVDAIRNDGRLFPSADEIKAAASSHLVLLKNADQNICYVNSLLQCFARCKRLVNPLAGAYNSEMLSPQKTPMLHAVLHTLMLMWRGRGGMVASAKALVDILPAQIGQNFREGNQNCVCELYFLLVRQLHIEWKRHVVRGDNLCSNPEPSDDFVSEPQPLLSSIGRFRSFKEQPFYSFVYSPCDIRGWCERAQCEVRHRIIRRNSFIVMDDDTPEPIDLVDHVRRALNPPPNADACDGCGASLVYRVDPDAFGQYLVFRVSRFVVQGRKLKKRVSYPYTLDITSIINEFNREPKYNNISYALVANVVHYGDSPNRGHYVANVHIADDHWECISDDTHSRISSEKDPRNVMKLVFLLIFE